MRVLTLLAVLALTACAKNDPEPQKDMATDTKLWPDLRGVDEPFGRVCTNLGKPCTDKDPEGYDLMCIGIQGGTAGKGFCSRSCTDVGTECYGAPNGQSAGCFISAASGDAGGGDKFCGFLCKTSKSSWACPGTLTCGKTDKDGNAICVP